jgi:hypothetical protein
MPLCARVVMQHLLNMKKLIIRLIALLASVSTAILIDVTYCWLFKDSVYPSTLLFSFECLTIGLSIFAMLYTYSFYKNKLEDLW